MYLYLKVAEPHFLRVLHLTLHLLAFFALIVHVQQPILMHLPVKKHLLNKQQHTPQYCDPPSHLVIYPNLLIAELEHIQLQIVPVVLYMSDSVPQLLYLVDRYLDI